MDKLIKVQKRHGEMTTEKHPALPKIVCPLTFFVTRAGKATIALRVAAPLIIKAMRPAEAVV
jgi:hypothetical protein